MNYVKKSRILLGFGFEITEWSGQTGGFGYLFQRNILSVPPAVPFYNTGINNPYTINTTGIF